MPATLREVLKTNTFEQQRQIINNLGQDFYSFSNGTSSFGNIINLEDGSAINPSLRFFNDSDSGIYRDQYLKISSNGSTIASFEDTRLKFSKKIEAESNKITDVSVYSSGNYYFPSSYSGASQVPFNVPFSGGTGFGAVLSVVIQPFQASVNTYGLHTSIGTFNVSFTNGSGSNGDGVVTIRGINGGTVIGGSGYTDFNYSNVELIGGNGSGAEASVVVVGGSVTSIAISNHGSGYLAGDILQLGSLNGVNLQGAPFVSGGSGASYTVPNNPYGVVSLVPDTSWYGEGYEIGDVVGFTGGGVSGSGGTFTLDKIGYVSSVSIPAGETGFGYVAQDILTAYYSFGSGEIVNGIVRYVDLTVNTVNQIYIEVTSSSSFSNGETLTFSGGSTATIISTGRNSSDDVIYLYIDNVSSGVSATETFTSSGGGSGIVDVYGSDLVFQIEDPDTGILTVLPEFNLKVNYVYNFIQNDIEFNSYPITFSTEYGSSAYTNLVRTIQTSENRNITQLVVTSSTPDLYYSTNALPNAGGHENIIKTLSLYTTNLDASGFSVLVDDIISGNISISITSSGNITSTGDTNLNNLYVGGTAEFANLSTGASSFAGSTTTISSNETIVNSFLNVNNGTFVVHPEGKVSFKSTSLPTRDVYLNSSFETQGNTILSSRDSDYTTIGLVSEVEAKFEVNGDSKFGGKIIVSDGSLNNPSLTFNSDRTVGLFLDEEPDTNYSLNFNNKEGSILKITKDASNFYRDVYLTTSEITDINFIGGFGYENGIYESVSLIGGSGGGLIADLIVAFGVDITNSGQGYTNAIYENIPVSYATLPVGAIQTVNSFVAGSNYADGSYSDILLIGGSGINASGNFTISGGIVTNFTTNSKGTEYQSGDILEVNVSDIGGSRLSTLSAVNGGTDYQESDYTNIPLTNLSSSGSGGTVDLTVNQNGQISVVNVNNQGSGYSLNDTFTVSINVNGSKTFTITQPGGLGTDLFFNGVNRTSSTISLIEGNIYTFDNSGISEPVIIASGTAGPTEALESNFGVDYQLDGVSVTSTNYIANFSSATTKEIIYTVPAGLEANEDIHYYYIESDSNTGGSINYKVQSSGSGVILNATSVISGSGFSVEVATVGQALSGQAGTGAGATIEIINGTIDSFAIVDSGVGYNIGHQLTISTSNMVYDDGFSLVQTETPSEVITFTVSSLGSITSVDITDSGNGYVEGDVLYLNASTGSGLDNGDSGVFDITSVYVSTTDSPTSISLSESGYVATLVTDQNPSPAIVGTFPGLNNTNSIVDNNLSQQFIIRVGQNTQASTLVLTNVGSANGFLSNGSPIFSPNVGPQISDPPSLGASSFSSPAGFNWNAGNSSVGNIFNIDSSGGYAVSGNLYQYTLPNFLKSNTWLTVLASNTYYSSSNFNGDNSRHANGHSKIIGISADGYPIYGPFGYSSELNSSSGISRQTSSYRTKLNDNHRPSGSKYTNSLISSVNPTYTITLSAGIFIEDYEYVNGLGTLDQFNGRYCVTPEYPNGTYSYFVTFDGDNISSSNASYPYLVGPQFKETPFTSSSSPIDPGEINPNTINTSDFKLTLSTVIVENTISLIQSTGTVSAKTFDLNESFSINNILNISSSGISSSENINITPGNSFALRINGTTALALPRGTTLQRPGNARSGSIRFNTQNKKFEGFDGEYFVSLGGVIDVDGNTYITAEKNAGDNDNILRFYNDSQESLSIGLNKITIKTPSFLHVYNTEGMTEWVAGNQITAPANPEVDSLVYVYYEENVYSVISSGTFDTDVENPPTHTFGTEVNGTVSLQWIRTSFGDLNYKSNNFNLIIDQFNINNNALKITNDSNNLNLSSELDNLNINFGPQQNTLLRINDLGSIYVNNTYGSFDQFIKILDYELKDFNLKNTRIFTAVNSIDTSSGNATNITIVPYNSISSSLESYSGKIMVEIIDDSSTPRRQYTELSFLVKSDLSDTLYTENNKLYTDVELCDISVGIDASNNISVDIIDVTNSSSVVYTIKVVSQLILV